MPCLFLLCECLLRVWVLIQVEIKDLYVVERDMLFCTDTTANSNHTQPLHVFEINIIGSAAIATFVKVAALIRYDFDFIDPGASTCFQLTNVLVIIKFKAMAFDTIWQGLSKMDSGIVTTLVV